MEWLKQDELLITKNNNQNCDGHKDLHKKDVRAIILYLFLRYPEKYYPYKYEMYSEFVSMVDGDRISNDDIQYSMMPKYLNCKEISR